jgi:hypothetical protein
MVISCLLESRNGTFKPHTYKVRTAVANTIRYHTKDTASIEISFPKMAVNPKIKTIP